ncbi:MAG: hypothetical protein GEV06_12900 [Luteitalea sp.]|nr:hypothetical protein [Luteitalea sp.]
MGHFVSLVSAGRQRDGRKRRGGGTVSRLTATALAVVLAAPGVASGQELPERKPQALKRVEILRDRGAAQDAQRTREQLQDLLGRLPPSVSQVLNADPTLLANTEYLSPYPELGSFLEQHPEVSRDLRFFVGDAESIWRSQDPRAAMQRFWESMFGVLIPFGIFLVVAGGILWILKTALDHRRWRQVVDRQTELRNKLLDRFASHEDLMALMRRCLRTCAPLSSAGLRASTRRASGWR